MFQFGARQTTFANRRQNLNFFRGLTPDRWTHSTLRPVRMYHGNVRQLPTMSFLTRVRVFPPRRHAIAEIDGV